MQTPELNSGHIRVATEDRCLRITLDRPDKRNALTRPMYDDLIAAVGHAEENEAVRAVLIDAAGDMFCAGNDINDFANADPHADDSNARPAMTFVRSLSALDKPVVAAVQGQATGIGTTMLLHTDLVIAGEGARFVTAFIDLGLVPEAASSMILPALIGRQNAARLLLAGDTLSAEEAQRVGLIAYRVADDALAETANDLMRTLCAKSPTALRYTKQLVRHGLGSSDIEGQINREIALFRERLASDEVRAVVDKFLKRAGNKS